MSEQVQINRIVSLSDLSGHAEGVSLGSTDKPITIVFGRKDRAGEYPSIPWHGSAQTVFLDMGFAIFNRYIGGIVVNQNGEVSTITDGMNQPNPALRAVSNGSVTTIHVVNTENSDFYAYFELSMKGGQYVLRHSPQTAPETGEV
ncbi:hypothetical protein KC640_02545 [Candidatus Dojkabacteria bacterium]|uniref:Uncharacterized protein n=1 Tax=Candidatus Dojkabacteria bacterium TaxID=2099670 RepID=A0A955I9P5_9BACT|nr:hypothetical protein [Candidatus Dojkabacteria bacterium]